MHHSWQQTATSEQGLTKSKLSQCKATRCPQAVDLLHKEIVMFSCPKLQDGPCKIAILP